MATAIRVGQGFDIHRFEDTPSGRVLVLGGVQFAGERALVGHSDADVIAHAIADALLGAASLGDIGQHFPDTDPKWAGVDSLLLLSRVVALVKRTVLKLGMSIAAWSVKNPSLRLIVMRCNVNSLLWSALLFQ